MTQPAVSIHSKSPPSVDVDGQTSMNRAPETTATNHRLTTWNLITLSIAMLGAQIAWTVELGYGTPFLLQLGVTEQLTSLVWLAAPISGLIAQPLIGAVSDSSPSKYRRRFWIILSTIVLIFSTLLLAFCQNLAAFFVDVFQVGEGDWDAQRDQSVRNTSITFAVIAFYLLDFSLNGLQASLRNLLLDITPAAQLSSGNAWHSRMTNAGNIIGYGFGFFPLAKLPFIRWVGGTQFRKFCIICIVVLIITVTITCYFHEEEERPELRREKQSHLHEIVHNVYLAVLKLPKSIRQVCVIQLFAFMGWFPFLFYATTYIGQMLAAELGKEPNAERAARSGELALLLNSLVATVSSLVLPVLSHRNKHLLAHEDDVTQDAEFSRLRGVVERWRVEATRKGKRLRLPFMPFLLRNVWSFSLFMFSLLTWSTFFVHDVVGATAFVAIVGISWSVALWAPFAIIMELLKDRSVPHYHSDQASREAHLRAYSSSGDPVISRDERQPLLPPPAGSSDEEDEEPIAGGTILGIHNMAIVMPQFLVALTSSLIFHIVDGDVESTDPTDPSTYYGRNGVAWVLRFGGLCTFFGAFVALMVPPTPTEQEMKRRLGEMKFLLEETS